MWIALKIKYGSSTKFLTAEAKNIRTDKWQSFPWLQPLLHHPEAQAGEKLFLTLFQSYVIKVPNKNLSTLMSRICDSYTKILQATGVLWGAKGTPLVPQAHTMHQVHLSTIYLAKAKQVIPPRTLLLASRGYLFKRCLNLFSK